MKAVILAGGQGTRLRPITETIPKPMVTVMGKPIMEHLVSHLARHGFTDLLAILHYRPRIIRDRFGDGSDFGVNLRYTLERKPLGTAGSVRLGAEFLDETFLVIAGDALTDFDLAAFRAFHHDKGAPVSLCLKRVSDPSEFGVVITDAEHRVQRFLEKPGPSEIFSDTVNTGIYLIEPEILRFIPPERPYDFAGDLFPQLLKQGVSICAYVADGHWSDIGTLEQLKQAHWDFLDGKVRLPMSGDRIRDQVWVGEGVRIASDATLNPPAGSVTMSVSAPARNSGLIQRSPRTSSGLDRMGNHESTISNRPRRADRESLVRSPFGIHQPFARDFEARSAARPRPDDVSLRSSHCR